MKLVRNVFEYLRALARELSDEGAYSRHLQITGHAHSAAEWRSFIDQRHQKKYQSGKCC